MTRHPTEVDLSTTSPELDDGTSELRSLARQARTTIAAEAARIDAVLAEGPGTASDAAVAQRTAHKIAGTAGTVGMPRSSSTARSLADVLAAIVESDDIDLVALATARGLTRGLVAAVEEESALLGDLGGRSGGDAPARLLALSDDPDVARTVREGLLMMHLEVVTLSDPHGLADVVRGAAPAAVLVDADRFDDLTSICSTVRSAGSWDTPVLAVSAGGAPAQVEALLDAGVDDYIPAPILGSVLRSRVARAIELAGLRRAVRRTAALEDQPIVHGARPTVEAPAEKHGGLQPTTDVFIVEDDDTLVALLQQALENRGLRSEHVVDGTAALARLVGPGALRARVILLDVDLPGTNGRDVLRKVREAGVLEHSRVVMLTAVSDSSFVREVMREGAFDFIAKPFSLSVLTQRLRRALAAGN